MAGAAVQGPEMEGIVGAPLLYAQSCGSVTHFLGCTPRTGTRLALAEEVEAWSRGASREHQLLLSGNAQSVSLRRPGPDWGVGGGVCGTRVHSVLYFYWPL